VAEENTVEGFRQAVHDSLQQNDSEIQKNVFAARMKYCWEEQERVLKEIYSVYLKKNSVMLDNYCKMQELCLI